MILEQKSIETGKLDGLAEICTLNKYIEEGRLMTMMWNCLLG